MSLSDRQLNILEQTIRSVKASKGRAMCEVIAKALKQCGESGFTPNDWCGYGKFIKMIEAYPNNFSIIEHSHLRKEIILLEHNDSNQSAEQPQTTNMSFDNLMATHFPENRQSECIEQYGLGDEMRDFCIFSNYLRYTYHKAIADGKVLMHENVRMFHTGWFHNDTDPVYMIWGCVSNSPVCNLLRRSSSAGREYRLLFDNRVPEIVTFQTPEFHADWDVEPEFGHIFDDRSERLPGEIIEMLRSFSLPDGDFAGRSNEGIVIIYRNFLRRLLMGCIDDTRRRIQNRLEEAVPFWFKRNNKMCWLLPLRMGIAEDVNLVAVLEPTTLNGKDTYIAPTVLGLKEAYKCARVLGPVRAGWLSEAWRL